MNTKLLQALQAELKAPKNKFNSFGKYKYRSCEGILEAVKPILAKYGVAILINDEIECIGGKNYVKAVAELYDEKSERIAKATAYAREADNRAGMDPAQITGTASSYARKYALNGLFAIDDTKDPDTDEFAKESSDKAAKAKDERIKDFMVWMNAQTDPALIQATVQKFYLQLDELQKQVVSKIVAEHLDKIYQQKAKQNESVQTEGAHAIPA